MKLRKSIPVLGLALVAGFAALAQQTQSAKTQTSRGLHTTTFETAQGSVRVYLPDDLSAGDTISGTVLAEPRGQTEEERRRNSDELSGCVVEVEKAQTPVTDKVLKWQVPAGLNAGSAILILRDRGGKSVGQTEVPILNAPQTPRPPVVTPGDYRLPTIGQTGRPIQVAGPFDGDFSNTTVRLGGREVEKLAESPRKLVVESPRDLVGPAELEIKEGNTVAKGEYRNLAISLRAPKTTLLKGERTTLTIEAQGLKGLEEDAPVTISSRSQEIAVEGGDEQTFVIRPEDVSPAGTFTLTRTLTGVRPGNFQIVATVARPEPPEYSCCERDIKVGAAAVAAQTSLVSANTKRKVEVKMQFPITFACDAVKDQDCIGKFAAEVEDQPLQLDPATGNYAGKPINSALEPGFVKEKCDGKKHSGAVTVSWEATYPGTDQVKGTLKLKLTVPAAKGKVKHTFSVDVDASGNVAKTGTPTLVPTPEPQKQPEYSCCEKDIKLTGTHQVGKSETALVNNGTRRRVAIPVQFPITFSCDTAEAQDCIGKISVEIEDQPNQLNPPTRRYDVKPIASGIRADWSKQKCDGKNHRATITVSWEATYPGIHEVKGTLKLKLTVPDAKGKVNHTYALDVEASGNSVKPTNPKLDPAK